MPPNWPVPDGGHGETLSAAMMDYWVSFAATGTPHSDNGPVWRPYADEQSYILFGDEPVADHDPVPGMFELNEEFVRRRREAGQQWFINAGVNARPVCPENAPCE